MKNSMEEGKGGQIPATSANACCGLLSLRTATKSIALFQVVISIVAVAGIAGVGLGNLPLRPQVNSDILATEPPLIGGRRLPKPPMTNEVSTTVEPKKVEDRESLHWINQVIVLLVVVVLLLLLLVASINLFKGVRDGVKRKCKMWIVINVLLFILMAMAFGVLCFSYNNIYVLSIVFAVEIVHGYFIFVVSAFIRGI